MQPRSRPTVLLTFLPVLVVLLCVTPALAQPGFGMGGGMGMGMHGDMMGGTPQEMQAIMGLFHGAATITRDVKDIPGGVETTTVSVYPEVAMLIRQHVWQMTQRIESGAPIRQGDPLFVEIFRHHEAINMEVEDIPGGVAVRETSEDPQVALLIRQHARRAVSEFLYYGMRRMMWPTPLPEGYTYGN